MQNLAERYERMKILLGEDAIPKLAAAKVLVAGLGGVGSFAVEALARAGIGYLQLVDFDTVAPSNLNRQLLALEKTIGCSKATLAAERVRQINSGISVVAKKLKISSENVDSLISDMSYVVDAIDDIDGKEAIALHCLAQDIPLVVSLGTARRLDPAALHLTTLDKTYADPLARLLRQRLRKKSVDLRKIQVVCSSEAAISQASPSPLGSMPFVPPVAGMILAGKVVRDLAGI